MTEEHAEKYRQQIAALEQRLALFAPTLEERLQNHSVTESLLRLRDKLCQAEVDVGHYYEDAIDHAVMELVQCREAMTKLAANSERLAKRLEEAEAERYGLLNQLSQAWLDIDTGKAHMERDKLMLAVVEALIKGEQELLSEWEMLEPAHDGICGPETNCDGVCMDRYHTLQHNIHVRTVKQALDTWKEGE